LKARGFSGPVTFVDAITGKKRSTIPDIERAADLCTKEGPLRFAKVSRPDRSPRPQEVSAVASPWPMAMGHRHDPRHSRLVVTAVRCRCNPMDLVKRRRQN
jgi:hypothetical protein